MLWLKAWRDTLAHKGQFLALIVLVSLGITSFVTFQNSYYNLRTSLDSNYRDLNFSDATARVDRAPFSVARSLERLEGIEAARVRTVQDVGAELPNGDQATARIVSIADEPRAAVNAVYLQAGRHPRPDARNEVLLHSKFSIETGVGVNDFLTLRIGGERRHVRVVGLATDPEYFYPLRSTGDLPSPGEFAVVYATERVVQDLFGTAGSGNDVAVKAPSIDSDDLVELLEDELAPYGVTEVVPRIDQTSYSTMESELDQNRTLARTLPVLVLVISSLSLFIALSRMVTAQRGEIGLAKALGYSDSQILLHYLSYGLIIATAGSVLGVVFGVLGAGGFAATYATLLGMPILENSFYPGTAAIAVGIAVASCLLAAIVPALNSARLAPAIAMHSDPNKSLVGGRVPLVERLLGPILPRSFTVRIPLRNVFRARRRSVYTIFGIAFAMILSVATVAMFDSMDYLMEDTFENAERWDIMVAFDQPVGEARATEVRRLEGVERVQPALSVPVTISFGDAEEDLVLTAMRPDADFHGFTQPSGADPANALAAGDLVLSSSTAQNLGVSTGTLVQVDSPLANDSIPLRVGSTTEEALGQPAYVSFDIMCELIGMPGRYNVMYLDADSNAAERIQDELYDMSGVASVQIKATLTEKLEALLASFDYFGTIMLIFGGALAFVVIFTTFSANVSERSREIATMRTIGEDNLRLTIMITLENLLLAVFGLPLGVWLGILSTEAMFRSFSTDAYTITAYIYPESIVRICLLMLLVLLLSEIPPVRRIFRLDLAEATKVME